jgi:hypothetical protein
MLAMAGSRKRYLYDSIVKTGSETTGFRSSE